MTILVRPLGYTGKLQQLIWSGSPATITARAWGGGGGGGGRDSSPGGSGSGGGFKVCDSRAEQPADFLRRLRPRSQKQPGTQLAAPTRHDPGQEQQDGPGAGLPCQSIDNGAEGLPLVLIHIFQAALQED